MMTQDQREIRRKRRVLEHAERTGNTEKTCRYFGVPRSTFYRREEAFEQWGDEGLLRKRPVAKSHPNATPREVVEKILHLRRKYHLRPIRIVWCLEGYHGIRVSDAGVYRILRRHGMNRLPRKVGRRAVHTKRYEKRVAGHHVPVDVTFLKFKGKDGELVKRYHYTAIDDATRIRALKIYSRTIKEAPSTLPTTSPRSSRFGYRPSARTAAMNSKQSSTGPRR